jgi:hypothetical protein
MTFKFKKAFKSQPSPIHKRLPWKQR